MENRKKIVVLDGYTLCTGELNFDALREFGEVTVYDLSLIHILRWAL